MYKEYFHALVFSQGDGYTAYASQVRSALAPVNKANEDASIITKVLELENGGTTYLHAKYDDKKYACATT